MKILAIDPGSTSTKIGVHHDGSTVKASIGHPREELEGFSCVMDQFDYRMECIDRYLAQAGCDRLSFDAVVGRGGLVRPVAGGVYLVDENLVRDLRDGVSGEHAANLGGVLALGMARRHRVPAYVVDPPVIDEMWPVARLSGLAGVERRSMFHALNQKAVARDVARQISRGYESLNLIVAHLGSGITVGAHRKGRVVDVNNGLNGDGPFSPERAGGLPVAGVLQLLEQGIYTTEELKKVVAREGGVYSYLGTVDLREAEGRADSGDAEAQAVIDAMLYQVAKEIGGLAAALDGEVDGIVITGGLAFSETMVACLKRKVEFIAPVFLRPGEYEIEALIEGALRVLTGIEEPKLYAVAMDEDRPAATYQGKTMLQLTRGHGMKSLIEAARRLKGQNLVLVCPDRTSLLAVNQGIREGILEKAHLVGNVARIKEACGGDLLFERHYEFVDLDSSTAGYAEEAARTGVELIRAGAGDMLMKGRINTAVFIKAVLQREVGIGTGRRLSNVSIFALPGVDRLIFLTDPAINPELFSRGDAASGIDIIDNAIEVARALGVERPRVALLEANEVPSAQIPTTLLEQALSEREWPLAEVSGPLSYDLALYPDAVAKKGLVGNPVAGRADIIVVPHMSGGNFLYKSWVLTLGAEVANAVLGARAPIILTSRSDSDLTKFLTICASALYSRFSRRTSPRGSMPG